MSGIIENSPVTSKIDPIKKGAEYLTADKGLDDGKLIKKPWNEYTIKPVIDIRNLRKDHDSTKLVPGHVNVVYNYQGTVFCYCPKQMDKAIEMAFGGFEKDRAAQKYRCPVKHYGYVFKGMEECPVRSAVRIPLDVDRRIFIPVTRSSYKWVTLCKKITAALTVEQQAGCILRSLRITVIHHFHRISKSGCIMVI